MATETKATFTPGPWIADGKGWDCRAVVEDSRGNYLALVGPERINPKVTNDVAEANARLIASAPELLACLRRMCGMYGAYSKRLAPLLAEDEGTIWTFERANSLALEAIAKAEDSK